MKGRGFIAYYSTMYTAYFGRSTNASVCVLLIAKNPRNEMWMPATALHLNSTPSISIRTYVHLEPSEITTWFSRHMVLDGGASFNEILWLYHEMLLRPPS